MGYIRIELKGRTVIKGEETLRGNVLLYKKKEDKENSVYRLCINGETIYFDKRGFDEMCSDKSKWKYVNRDSYIERYMLGTELYNKDGIFEWIYKFRYIAKYVGNGVLGRFLDIPCIMGVHADTIAEGDKCFIELNNGTVIDIKKSVDTMRVLGNGGAHYMDIGIDNIILVMNREEHIAKSFDILYFVIFNNTKEELGEAGISREDACNAVKNTLEIYRNTFFDKVV